jgi:GNAT superfamily N-acetyltransferase
MTGATAPSDAFTISRLGDDELDGAQALVSEAGWNQVPADWKMFLQLGTVYAVRDGHRLAATAATLPYGNRFAWISMVLVAGSHRRRGLATRLLRRCVDDLIADKLVPVLDATPAGRPIYHTLGFEDSWGFQRLAGAPHPPAAPPDDASFVVVEPITEAIWPALVDYDTRAFGADRGALLSDLRGRLPAVALCVRRNGELAGFLLGRDGRSATQIGPLIAEDDAVALALLRRSLATIEGPVYIDVADSKSGVAAFLTGCGFVSQRPFTRMLHRRHESFDDTARTFAVVGPEFG